MLEFVVSWVVVNLHGLLRRREIFLVHDFISSVPFLPIYGR